MLRFVTFFLSESRILTVGLFLTLNRAAWCWDKGQNDFKQCRPPYCADSVSFVGFWSSSQPNPDFTHITPMSGRSSELVKRKEVSYRQTCRASA